MNQENNAIAKSRDQWNKYANHWESQAEDIRNKYTKRNYWISDLIERNKIEPCKTLDLGCANGLLSSILAEKGFDTYGIDVSDQLIRLAVQRMVKYFHDAEKRFRHCQNDKLPFADISFKLVTMIGVFAYIQNQRKYLHNVYHMIEDDGYMIVSSSNRFSIYIILHIVKHVFMFRPTKTWGNTLLNLARTGIESGGNIDYHSADQVHNSSQFDSLFKGIGFQKVDEIDLFHISFLDKNPLNRSKYIEFLSRHLGWNHIGVYKKINT